MLADSDPQLWLETGRHEEQLLVVPHARSARALSATYELVVRKSGASGASRISQRGIVELAPGDARPLSRFTLNLREGDECRIELSLREGETLLRRHDFDCGR
jgi:hypothetical protein